MPVYEYTALDVKGNTLSGIVDADSPAGARQKLRAAGSYPVSCPGSRSASPRNTLPCYSIDSIASGNQNWR